VIDGFLEAVLDQAQATALGGGKPGKTKLLEVTRHGGELKVWFLGEQFGLQHEPASATAPRR
jgi:hypothetical protein